MFNNGGSTSYNNASYDAGAGKVIISYAQGNAATIAGTVSGTSISFDTVVVLDAGGGMGEVGQAYDSTNAKTLIAFQSAGNSYHGYSATATYGDLSLTEPLTTTFKKMEQYLRQAQALHNSLVKQ